MSLRMNGAGGTERDEIRVVVGLNAVVAKIDGHFGDEVVFLLRRGREEEAFRLRPSGVLRSNSTLPSGCFAIENSGQGRRFGLLDERTDRRAIEPVQCDAVSVFDRVVQQDASVIAAAPVRQAHSTSPFPQVFVFSAKDGDRFGGRGRSGSDGTGCGGAGSPGG